ncbi:hypothetical protein CC86DRAFT_313452 [Ophiobolus disseminans]|uniref:Malate dehydrogenase n=1 Tax=Ophiobolus disseminans TaxID=1469910 RepID=A0A6A7AGJ8_9PLEO|nr:hypothetical protein CC86DRAFT_313452 [Ophiobolus disseminans]
MFASALSTVIATVALLTASTCALPHPAAYAPASDLSKLAKLLPASTLPAPDGKLKYVVLGIGTQNYTCTSGNPDAAPGTTGAVATLYDIGTKLNNDNNAKWKIPTISPLALSLSAYPKLLEWNLGFQGYTNVLGHHFFNSVGGTNTPIFALDQLVKSPYPMAQVLRVNDVAAPTSACPGLESEGAVRWLFLKDNKGISLGGIDTVYRLETAGGSAPATCKGKPASFEVKYAAQYWIYGPRD